ncbi:MAG: hypothetical protein EP350_03715 [Alphaproteobacteria bacterium]|nr:MAG: hypothetical protein EP350_03715 [Alphaproteobacteria bacterium]
MRNLYLALSAVFLALPVSANEPEATKSEVGTAAEQPQPEADKEAEKSDLDKVKCKFTMVVDSRIPQKICMTEFEWEQRRRDQIEARRSSQNRSSSCGDSGPC